MEDTSFRDRVRVFRVRALTGEATTEISGCWIMVHPRERTIRIWLSPDRAKPDYTYGLADVVIDWFAPTAEG